jgi:uracil-DNA glycosylase family 4
MKRGDHDALLACTRCKRLAHHLAQVRAEFPAYHARPVVPFGDAKPKLLIVGLAPGMHGANRSGRPFTGDYAGILLYKTLYNHGLANIPEVTGHDDGLKLTSCRITNAVKCLPPQNKPLPDEINRCNAYLRDEIAGLPPRAAILALGGIAHTAVLKAVDAKKKDFPFGHALEHHLPGGRTLFDSYHCSRYNTNTRRLTPEMFDAVIQNIARRINSRTE